MSAATVESHYTIKRLNIPRAHFFPRDVLVALLILTGVSLARAVIIRSIPLTGDEAYYWMWSKHLAFGYHDHPPLVAYLIALFSIFGKSAFWVRFPGLLFSFLSGLFLFLFAKDVWKDEQAGLIALSLYLFIPIFSALSLVSIPDSPLIFSWSFFLWASWKWTDNKSYWPWMGLALGLGILSKAMGLFLLPSFALFLALSRKRRSFFKRKSLWASLGLAALITAPFFYWNFQHHFETFMYQVTYRLNRHPAFSLSAFLSYLGLEAAAVSPLVFVVLVGVIVKLVSRARHGDERSVYLCSMALPMHLFFLGAAFFMRAGLHWALPGYLAIMAALPAIGKVEIFFRISLVTAFLFTAVLYGILLQPLKLIPEIASLHVQSHSINEGKTVKTWSLFEIYGYKELGKIVDQKLTEMSAGSTFVFTDSYSLSSAISFYSGVDVKSVLYTPIGGEFLRWNRFPDNLGKNALYVDIFPVGKRPDIDVLLHRAFKKIIPFGSMDVHQKNLHVGTFYFARCIDLVNPKALEPPISR